MNPPRLMTRAAIIAAVSLFPATAPAGKIVADLNDLYVDALLTEGAGQDPGTGSGFADAFWAGSADAGNPLTVAGDLPVPAGVANFVDNQDSDINGGSGVVASHTNSARARRGVSRNTTPLTGSTIWFAYTFSLGGPASEGHLVLNAEGSNNTGGAPNGFGVIMGDNDRPGCLGIVQDSTAYIAGGTTPTGAGFLMVENAGAIASNVIPTDGTSHLILGRIDVDAAAAAPDTLSIWLDPADALAPGAPTLVDSSLDVIDAAGLTWLSIEVVTNPWPPANFSTGGQFKLDNLRISDDPDALDFVTGQIIIDPDLEVDAGLSLDPNFAFGLLDEDSTTSLLPATRSMSFGNGGATQPITITGVTVAGDDDGVFTVTTDPVIGGGLVLDPGDTFDVYVDFDNVPGKGDFGGEILIATSVPSEDITLPVSATYIATGDKVISNGSFENANYLAFWGADAATPFGGLAPGSATAVRTTGNALQQLFDPAVGDDFEISLYFAVEEVAAAAGNRNFSLFLRQGGGNYINMGYFPSGASPTQTTPGFYVYDGAGWVPVVFNNGDPETGSQVTISNSLDALADGDYDDPGDGDVKNVYQMRIAGAEYGDIFYNYRINVYDAAGNLLGWSEELTEHQGGDPATGQPDRLIFSAQYGNNPGFVVDDVCVVVSEDDGSGLPVVTNPDLQVLEEPTYATVLNPAGSYGSDLVIRNSGSAGTDLNVSAVNFSDPHFALNGGLPGPIAPGGTATLPIDFTPGVDRGVFPCTISIDSNDSLIATETVEVVAAAWDSGDVVNANCDFEATPFDDGWINTGATQVSELDGAGGAQAAFVEPGAAVLAQNVVVGGDWEFECQFAVQAGDPASRKFGLILTTSNQGATGAATIAIRYGEGTEGFSVFGNGGWQPMPSLGTLLASVDNEPDGALDTANVYQMKLVGRDWGAGSGSASYDILLSEANGTSYTRAATDLALVQNGNPETDLINGFRFDTVYGNNPGFWVDDACLKAGSPAADEPNLIVVSGPVWAQLLDAGPVSADLVVENTGAGALLEITGIGFTGDDAANFSVDPGVSFPVQVGAGTQATIPIVFEQGASPGGTFTATLEISSDDTTDAALGITRGVALQAGSFNYGDEMLGNWDFEADPFGSGWTTAGTVSQFGGLNIGAGSTRSAFLSVTNSRLFQAPAVGLENFSVEFHCALSSVSGRVLNFRVFGNAGATGTEILTFKYDAAAGGGAGRTLQVFDGAAWQNLFGLTLSPSLDFDGDGSLGNDPGDIRNVYRVKLSGRGFGTVDAEYDVAVLLEDGTPLGSALHQTYWRADATTNQARAVEFNTTSITAYWLDDVLYKVDAPAGGGGDFDTWAGGYGLGGGDAAPGADPDGDGLSNDKEYAFGLDPTDGSSVSPVGVPLDKASGIFTYTRRNTALTGLAYSYQWSTTLDGVWTPFTPELEDGDGGNPVETVAVTVPAALLGNPSLFVRVVAN